MSPALLPLFFALSVRACLSISSLPLPASDESGTKDKAELCFGMPAPPAVNVTPLATCRFRLYGPSLFPRHLAPRSPECQALYRQRKAALDALPEGRVGFVHRCILRRDPVVLTPNMFPRSFPPSIQHWTLWSRERLPRAAAKEFIHHWLCANDVQVPFTVWWNEEWSFDVWHVHVFFRSLPSAVAWDPTVTTGPCWIAQQGITAPGPAPPVLLALDAATPSPEGTCPATARMPSEVCASSLLKSELLPDTECPAPAFEDLAPASSLSAPRTPCRPAALPDHQYLTLGRLLHAAPSAVWQGLGWPPRFVPQAVATLIWHAASVDWPAFNATRQRANHVFGAGVMTGKGSFYQLLASQPEAPPGLAAHEIHPVTYLLYLRRQCAAFFAAPRPGVWLLKQTHASNGYGVTVISDTETLRPQFGRCAANNVSHTGYLVQQYIPNPLLLDGRKSEVRAYWLIACTTPWIVLYHRGTVRLNSEPFVWHSFANRWVHITNVAQQKDHPRYGDPAFQEGLKWSYEQLEAYLTQQGIAPARWVAGTLEPTMKRYLQHVFNAARPALRSIPGTFGFYAADFIVTDQLHVYITEVQNGPDLSIQSGGVKGQVVKGMLREVVAIEMEILYRQQQGLSLRSLDSVRQFEVLINEA